jgi:signal transduction histidine kinase
MKVQIGPNLRNLREMLRETAPPQEHMASRLRAVEKDVILPVKAVFVGILLYYFYFSRWFEGLTLPRSVAQEVVQSFFLIYLFFNIGVSAVLLRFKGLSMDVVERIIFSSNFLDGLFLSALTYLTGGFGSTLYWIFLGLIVRNAVSTPRQVPQFILNVSLILLYPVAGLLGKYIPIELGDGENMSTEPFLLRLFVLLLMAACCYGLQVLIERQRRAEEEAREFAARQAELHSAGRLAAQIAHQIKNPLCIINNAAYSLQRAVEQGKNMGTEQVRIIREEVEKSDQILTKLMGYAQLAEGKVEKLNIDEELDRAVAEVFPAGAYEAIIKKEYAPELPVLLMQRGHLSEILVNILQNAREATEGAGQIRISAQPGPDQSINLSIEDNGPGISKSQISKVFDSYFSTKEKGTGLGLSIVKHNVEMYGGTVSVQSELGSGATFSVHLPTRTFMKLRK